MTTAQSTYDLALSIMRRMREIDSDITKSGYNGGDDSKDRPPEGDDYNLLWDAILDEVRAYCPAIDAAAILHSAK